MKIQMILKNVWNDIYKQPDDVYDVFKNHKLIINNDIKYKIK